MQEAKGQFAGGSGTSTDPYTIATAEQLAKLAELVNSGTEYNDKCYKLANDIDLTEYGENWNNGAGWIPVGSSGNYPESSFRGEFDGNNKKITGLYINGSRNMFGLFGCLVSAKIQNLGVEGANVTGGGDEIGGIAGRAISVNITNCYSSGVLVGSSNSDIGGIVGVLFSSDITNCYSTCTIMSNADYTTGHGCAGGIVGNAGLAEDRNTISNCYSTGSVSGAQIGDLAAWAYRGVGSIAGSVWFYDMITNCAALAPTAKNNLSSVGRVIGKFSGMGGKPNNFGNIAFCGMTTGGGASFSGENTHNGKDGENRSAFELLKANGFPPGFTNPPWTYVPGRLPGLFGETVEMPPHLRTYVNMLDIVLKADGRSDPIYPINFVENDPDICDLTFLFVVDGEDCDNLIFTCDDIGLHTVLIVSINAKGVRSQLHELVFTVSLPSVPIAFDVIQNRDEDLKNAASITVYPIDFVTNVSYPCVPTFLFVVDGVEYKSLSFTCNDIGSYNVSIVGFFEKDGKVIRSQPQPVTFTVSDQTPPAFSVIPQNAVLDNSGAVTVYPADFVTNILDSCSDAEDISIMFVMNGDDHESLTLSCSDIGLYTVSIVVINGKKNRSQPKNVTFAVSDQTPPVATCKPATLYLDRNGEATLQATMIDNGSDDNCSITSRQIKRASDRDDQYAGSLVINLNDLEVSESGNTIDVTLRVSDASGNKATCTSEIQLIDLIQLSIPDIFTPNGDGINDTWDIQGINRYPNASIRVYNRAKKLLIELKGAQMPWDGRDRNGNLLESGYYLYQIELQRNEKLISGYVTILR